MSDEPRSIRSEEAPAPIGPYSQAVEWGGLVFCSGQVALDAASGELVAPESVERQTAKVLENLGAVLRAAGCRPEDVLKTTIYLTDLADFPLVNAVYAGVFGEQTGPARATVQVAGLPKGAKVEIDAVARRPS